MLTERPATPDDLHAVTDLLIAVDVQELGEPDWTVEDTEEEWRNPRLDLSRDTRLVLDGDRPVAYAYVVPRAPGEDYDSDTFVLSSHTHVEAGLLRFVEQRARETAGPGASVHLFVHAPNTRRAALVKEHGFEHVRTFWRMRRPLADPVPEPSVPDGLVLRTFAPGDERGVYGVLDEAFRGHYRHTPQTFEEWSAKLLSRSDFDPRLVFLVTDGDEVAAALTALGPVEGAGWVRALGVRRPWRGRGLGKALLYAAFREYASRGATDVALGVDAENTTGATRLYESAGMSVQRRFDAYRRSLDA